MTNEQANKELIGKLKAREIWKNVKGYENLYLVSNYGNIKRIGKNKNRKFNVTRNGYALVNLYKNGVSKNISVHRIVAEAFLKNIYNLPQVNHKNGVKTDNRVENLEWISVKENIKHSYRALGRKTSKGNKGNINRITKSTKPLIQYDLDGNFVKVWGSKENASRELKIDSATISNCCRDKRKSTGHYKWKYVEDEIPKLKSIIDLMSEQLAGLTIFDIDKDEPLILYDKEDVKQYFENKAKEV